MAGHPSPHRYKSKLCNNWVSSKGSFCPRGAQCHFAHGEHELRPEGSAVPAHVRQAESKAVLDPRDVKGDSVGAATQATLLAVGRNAALVARGTSMPGTEVDDSTLLSEEGVARANEAIFEAAARAGIISSAKPDLSRPVDPSIFHTGGGLGPNPFVKSGKGGVTVKPGGGGGGGELAGAGGEGGGGSGGGGGVRSRGVPTKQAFFTSPAFQEVHEAMLKSQAEGIRQMQLRSSRGTKRKQCGTAHGAPDGTPSTAGSGSFAGVGSGLGGGGASSQGRVVGAGGVTIAAVVRGPGSIRAHARAFSASPSSLSHASSRTPSPRSFSPGASSSASASASASARSRHAQQYHPADAKGSRGARSGRGNGRRRTRSRRSNRHRGKSGGGHGNGNGNGNGSGNGNGRRGVGGAV